MENLTMKNYSLEELGSTPTSFWWSNGRVLEIKGITLAQIEWLEQNLISLEDESQMGGEAYVQVMGFLDDLKTKISGHLLRCDAEQLCPTCKGPLTLDNEFRTACSVCYTLYPVRHETKLSRQDSNLQPTD